MCVRIKFHYLKLLLIKELIFLNEFLDKNVLKKKLNKRYKVSFLIIYAFRINSLLWEVPKPKISLSVLCIFGFAHFPKSEIDFESRFNKKKNFRAEFQPKKSIKKSRIRETKNLLTDADIRNNPFLICCRREGGRV